MRPHSRVEHDCRPGLVHGFPVSHHAHLCRKQNEDTCQSASSLCTSPRPPRIGFSFRALFPVLAVLFLWSSLVGTASATNGDSSTLLAVHVEDDLIWKGSTLYLDHREAPAPPSLMPPLHNDEDATQATKRAVTTDPNAGKGNFAIPEPFDTGLSTNFTNPCATFLNRMRQDDSFRKCHPFSLLLQVSFFIPKQTMSYANARQTSSGFFDASKSYLRITQTLDATCGVDATKCKQTMDTYAKELISSSACKSDLDNDTPLVIQALNGLVAYPVAYSASCLRDTEGSYCFANAVTNTSSPTDSYPYYLPIGQQLPAGSRPTCNTVSDSESPHR
jgi:hypothetical protein